jgi:hypothetical protein
MKMQVIITVLLVGLVSCQKCNLKGDQLLNESFDKYGEWLLYSEYSSTDQYYSRIENGLLILKSDQQFSSCQRATLNFTDDFSSMNGFQVCIEIKQLKLPKKVAAHFYFSLGKYELHAVVEKKNIKNNSLIFRVDDKGVSSNNKGALFGGLGNEIEKDNYSENFIQISLCPNEEVESMGELYLEIDGIEITTIN